MSATLSKWRNWSLQYFAVIPVLYLFLAIFLFRYQVGYIYIAAIVLVIFAFVVQYRRKTPAPQFLGRWMIVLGAIGLSAAFILSIEKVEALENPSHIASCSVSPIVTCSPIITSPQASALGFSNTFIGLVGFTAIFVAGMTLLAGASKLSKNWWRTLFTGTLLAAAFAIWLFTQGIFVIGTLCLYCMLVWLTCIALLWLITAHAVREKYLSFGGTLNRILSRPKELIIFSYAIIFFVLLFRWSEYWLGLVGL